MDVWLKSTSARTKMVAVGTKRYYLKPIREIEAKLRMMTSAMKLMLTTNRKDSQRKRRRTKELPTPPFTHLQDQLLLINKTSLMAKVNMINPSPKDLTRTTNSD